jgi:hypothetical protein
VGKVTNFDFTSERSKLLHGRVELHAWPFRMLLHVRGTMDSAVRNKMRDNLRVIQLTTPTAAV